MLTAPRCALTVTAPLSVQAALADRPNPPTRPLPADPVVRHPKVTVGGEKVTAFATIRAVVVVAVARSPLCAEGTYPTGALMVTDGNR